MIKSEDLYSAIDGGRPVILHYYPESSVGFESRRNFKLRPDDKNPSCCVYRNKKNGVWLLQDKGGSDNKAYTAIDLVIQHEHLEFPKAIEWIAANFAPELLKESVTFKPAKPTPMLKKMPFSDKMQVNVRASGIFTDKELAVLGYRITQDICEEFNLHPLDSYVNKANDKGDTWQIESHDDYPMFYYDYGDWGKIYQPLGDFRFLYFGAKPGKFWFGTRKFMEVWKNAENGIYPKTPQTSDDEDDELDMDETKDERFENLIICSGGSDALNVYAASTGNPTYTYQVCWPNSETQTISKSDINRMKRIAKNIFILYDSDETGIANTFKLALRDLELKIIELPANLSDYKTRKGTASKDIKDFMMYYKKGQINPREEFRNKLVKLAKCLKFWYDKLDKQNNSTGVEISNAHLYKFLSANGFYKIPSAGDNFDFCYIKGKVVEIIKENAIVSRVREFILNFLYENPEYYSLALENLIHRSKQFTTESLKGLSTINPNFDAFSKEAEYLCFQNCIVKITSECYETVKPDDCNFYVHKEKIIPYDFRIMNEPPFRVFFTDRYSKLLNEIEELEKLSPAPPTYFSKMKELDALTPPESYNVQIDGSAADNMFIRYLYNTGNIHWRKDSVNADEKKEIDMHFLNKITAIGFICSKFKARSNGKMVYCLETEQAEEGEHNGGTGKSLFMMATKFVRKYDFIGGQDFDTNDKFIWQTVDQSTDIVGIDDLNSKVDMNFFLPLSTGDFKLNYKNVGAQVIPFEKSPKIIISSNHSIKKFSGSLRRRIIFTAFSNYYHSKNPEYGMNTERSPRTEFGRDLYDDFTPEEWNLFFNFIIKCIQIYKCVGVIDPPMAEIEKRILQRALTDEFIYWADDFFIEGDRLNRVIKDDEAFESWKNTLSDAAQRTIRKTNFTKKLIDYCSFKDFEYNPDDIMANKSETEIKRNKIRFKEYWDGEPKDCYGFYIRDKKY